MKTLIFLTLTFSVLFGVVAPTPVLAQDAPSYDSFYEDGGPTITDGIITSEGFVPCSGTVCSLCHFAVMANTIIKWLIGIIFLFFAILAVVAGFKLVTSGGNPGAKQAAKSSFTNAFIGMFIVLGAWVLIDTLLRTLLAGGTGEISGFGPWSEIECAEQVGTAIKTLSITDPEFSVRSDTEGSGAAPFVVPPSRSVDSTELTHMQALSMLGSGFIISSSGGCSNASNSNCTSLDGVKKNTINRIVELRKKFGSSITITGGTEVGHASGQYSHSNGYKIDLRRTSALDNYIQNNMTSIGGNKYKDQYGNIYWREDSKHWDITITN